MPKATREALIAILEGALAEVTRRKGPHSTITKTLEGALQSGTHDDLRAGEFAFNRFSWYYEEPTLEDSRKKVQEENETARKLEAKQQEMIRKAKAQETKIKETEKEDSDRVKPRLQDVFGDWVLSDGTDFSRHDPLSAGKRRHLIAKARRRKRPSKPTPRPKRK